jgi:hypothetical protein
MNSKPKALDLTLGRRVHKFFALTKSIEKGGCDMATKDTHEQRFVWVKDKAGNEYVCRVMDLKNPKKVSKEDLKNCIDDASRAINIGD